MFVWKLGVRLGVQKFVDLKTNFVNIFLRSCAFVLPPIFELQNYSSKQAYKGSRAQLLHIVGQLK